MTKISQYPEIASPDVDDLLIGTDVENSNATKNFTLQSVIDLVPIPTLQQVSESGNTTTTSIEANSFVKAGGTSSEYLMANGSTSTTPTFQQVTDAGSITNDTVTINKAEGDQALIITGGNVTNGLLQITANDGKCIKVTADDGDTIVTNNTNGTAIRATSEEGIGVLAYSVEGNGIVAAATGGGGTAIDVDGASRGITVRNGGIRVIGVAHDDTGYQLSLSVNSAAKPSTNTWTIASDERVKTNINPYTKGLETVLAINPVTYDYNGKAGFDSTNTGNIGVIAQDVLNIIPESINTYHAKLNEEDEEKTELYNFDSHALTFILINAVKQLSAEVELLKAR